MPAALAWLIGWALSAGASALINSILNPPLEKNDTVEAVREKEREKCTAPPPPTPTQKGKTATLPVKANPVKTKPVKPSPIREPVVEKAFVPGLALLPALWQFVTTAYAGWVAGNAVRKVIEQLQPETPIEAKLRRNFRYGSLLCGNYRHETMPGLEWGEWIKMDDFQKNHQASYEGFAWWLAAQSGKVPERLRNEKDKGDFYDHGVILWPSDPRNAGGNLNLFFGSRNLSDLFAEMWALSLNHQSQTYRGSTWRDLDIVRLPYPEPRTYGESGSKTGAPSVDGLAESLSEILLKGAVIAGTANPTKPAVKLEGNSLQGQKTKTGGAPTCMWPADRGTVIGNQQAQNAVLDVVTNTQLVSVQNKLGPQVAGGITGWLGRFAKSIYLDKALNFFNFLLNVHNAMMLSRNLVATLGELQNLVINAIGKQMKNEAMENFDVNKVLGEQFKKLMETILGKENNDNLTKKISKWNRILSAATNLLNSVESMLFSLSEMMSLAGEYQGKVGNALKRSGVILEDSYEAMQEKWRMLTGKRFAKIDRVLRGIDKGTEVADNLTGIAGEAVGIPDQITELGKARKELYQSVADGKPENSPGNKAIKLKEEQQKTASQSPEIAPADKVKPED